MPAKLTIVITTQRTLKCYIAKLLLRSGVNAGIAQFSAMGDIRCARLGSLFLPVYAAADGALPNLEGIAPLQVILLTIIQCGRRTITASTWIIVVIFAAAVAGNQLS